MTRKIEQVLSECIDRLNQGETVEGCLASYPDLAQELGPLLRTASVLRQASQVQPSPAFKEMVRARALAALQDKVRRRQRRRWSDRLGWGRAWATVAAGIAALVLAGGGTVVASADAVPGHPLYAVKTGVERVQVALAYSDVEKAKLLAKFADRRLEEIAVLVDQGRGDEIDAVSVAMKNDLKEIGRRIGTDGQVGTAFGTAAEKAGQPDATVAPQTPPATTVVVPPPLPVDASSRGEADEDGKAVRAAKNAEQLKKALRAEALRQVKALERLLETAPEKDKPAIRRALLRLMAGYDFAADRGDDDVGHNDRN